MFDDKLFQDALQKYKEDFNEKWWKDEKYKWEAIKCFQDNWDLEADDFLKMLHDSLSKTYNLLSSLNYFPKQMIEEFAREMPDRVRALFRMLFDEKQDIVERILTFKKQAVILLKDYSYDSKSHYQNENAISTYLWLRYPDKYYIYKFGEVKKVADALNSSFSFKKGAYAENLRNFYSFYNEINNRLVSNSEMKQFLLSKLTESCYKDNDMHTLTIDFGFYVSRKYNEDKGDESKNNMWWPTMDVYDPGLSVQDWSNLLKNRDIFNDNALKIMKRIKGYGGEATCKQLSLRFGESINFYNVGSTALAKRIADKTHCALMKDYDGHIMWWPVLYLGKSAEDNETGSFVWKIRDELSEALQQDEALVNIQADNNFNVINNEKYTKDDFLSEVYMHEEKYQRIVNVLKRKKNIILQGAPGVGKTFAARRLAYSIIGDKSKEQIEFVQFHQNYTYEDFVMGYKPTKAGGFEMKYGLFYCFCKKAQDDPEKDYYFIIDEINRGNLSKIFGELLMLIEKDYRGTSAKLAYENRDFFVPENVYIIGMMNTADRSLAMIDYALRRRFSFVDMEPGFKTEGFKKYQAQLNNDKFNVLISKIEALNGDIETDASLGKGFCIGHSYFCGIDNNECNISLLRNIIEYDILPMLQEYWFDEIEKVEMWRNDLYSVLK